MDTDSFLSSSKNMHF